MKIKILILATSYILLSLLVGCSNNSTLVGKPESGTTTITVWTYYNGTAKEAFDELVEKFNKTVGLEHDIIIDAYSQGDVNQLADAVMASAKEDIGSQPMPNIFASYSDNAYKIDNLGLVVDLDTYFSDAELAEYRPEFIEDGRFGKENKLKIIPVAKSTEAIFVNITDFNKFAENANYTLENISTWEGLAEVAKAYYNWTDNKTPAPNDGKAFFGLDSMANFIIISARQLGFTLYEIDGTNITLNFPVELAKRVWDNFYIPYVNGHYANIGRFRADDANTGDILAYTASTASASYFPVQIETGLDSAYPVKCAVIPYPCFDDSEKFAIQQGAGMVIAKSDPWHENASAMFLKWFTDVEQNLEFSTKTAYLPVKIDALTFEAFEQNFKKTIAGSTDLSNNATLISAKTVFPMLKDYKLYANKPFPTSYESRKIMDTSLLNYAKKDLDAVNVKVNTGADKQDVIKEFISDDNFNKWYAQIISEINTVINP